MICPKCNCQNPDGSTNCVVCGNILSAPNTTKSKPAPEPTPTPTVAPIMPAEYVQPVEEEKNKKKFLVPLFIVLGILLILVIVFLILFGSKNKNTNNDISNESTNKTTIPVSSTNTANDELDDELISFLMPDVVGKSKEEAEKTLTEKGLIVEFDYKKDDNVAENNVISQSVASGEYVKSGDIIQLVISSGRETIKVADVVGKKQSKAVSTLEDQGFKVNVVEKYDATVEKGLVISQSPRAGSSQFPESTITIYVSKGKQPVTVNYDANGGSVSQSSDTKYHNSTYGTLPTPTKTGYTFDGWYTAKSGGDKITSSSTVTSTSNHTLYAHWTAKTYTLTFNANGGSVSTSSKQVAMDSEYGTLPTPTKTGHTFNGWYTAKSGGSKVSASTKMGASNVTVYAQWTKVNYTLTFNANGGSVSTSSKQVAYGSSYGTLPTPTRDYYTFLGWYTSSSGGSKVSSSTTMGTSNVTVYAHWELNDTSGWVLESNVPAGAQIVDEKWTYTYTEYKMSENSSESGWTLYNTDKTWGAVKGPVYYDPSNGSRKVTSEQYISSYTHHYVYYHRWNGIAPGNSNAKWGSDSSMDQGTRCSIDLTYALGQGYTGGAFDWKGSYACPHCGAKNMWLLDYEYDEPVYSTRWYYQEPVYTYYYKKSTTKTSYTRVTANSQISNVKHYVKYRPK